MKKFQHLYQPLSKIGNEEHNRFFDFPTIFPSFCGLKVLVFGKFPTIYRPFYCTGHIEKWNMESIIQGKASRSFVGKSSSGSDTLSGKKYSSTMSFETLSKFGGSHCNQITAEIKSYKMWSNQICHARTLVASIAFALWFDLEYVNNARFFNVDDLPLV